MRRQRWSRKVDAGGDGYHYNYENDDDRDCDPKSVVHFFFRRGDVCRGSVGSLTVQKYYFYGIHT